MGIDSSGWEVDQDRTDAFTAPSSAEVTDGQGGGDMRVWSLDREKRLNRLINRKYVYSLKTSTYSFAKAVVDTGGWQQSFEFVERSDAFTAPSSAEVTDGQGGGDMRVWSLDRVKRLNRLINRRYHLSKKTDKYTFGKAIVDTGGWSTAFEDQERDYTTGAPHAETLDGEGGGDMRVWSLDRTTKVDRLLNSKYVQSNLSSYPLAIAIVGTGGWETTWYNQERDSFSVSPDNKVEDGAGGDDMRVWSLGRVKRFNRLMNRRYANSNFSAYSFDAGVVDTGGFQQSFENVERSPFVRPASEDSIIAGEGGGNMQIWSRPKDDKFIRLINRNYHNSNVSSYELEPGVANTGGWDDNIRNIEKNMGGSAEGFASDPDRRPLSGVAIIRADGEEIRRQTVTGSFVLTVGPPTGVTEGSDVTSTPSYSFEFDPDEVGLSYTDSSIDLSGYTVSIDYGRIVGKVRDFHGNPVPDERITAGDLATTTDSNGRFELVGPGGNSRDLTSLRGAVTKPADFTAGKTNEVNFTFAGVRVTVQLPDGSGVNNAGCRLDIAGASTSTDGQGVATFTKVKPYQTGTLTILGSIEQQVSSNGEGQLTEVTQGMGAGFKGSVINSETHDAVRGIRVQVESNITTTAKTDNQGFFTIGTPEAGTITLTIGQFDKRFVTTTITKDVNHGEVIDQDIELQTRQNVPTY